MAITQKPKQLFNIAGIEDPVMRSNFDILNRELLARQTAQQIAPANVAFSRGVYRADSFGNGYGGSAGLFLIPGFDVQITTRGNPVEFAVVGTDDTTDYNTLTAPRIQTKRATGGNATIVGFMVLTRFAGDLAGIVIYREYFNLAAETIGGNLFADLRLPVISYVDTGAGKGSYRYTLSLYNTQSVTMFPEHVRLMAQELR